MKKTVSGRILLVLSITSVFAGCTTGESTGSDPIKTDKKAVVSTPGKYPLINEKITLKVFTQQDPFVENYGTNDFTQWYEEKTNVRIEWEAVQSAAVKEKLQVKLASSDQPDVYLNASLSANQLVMFGGQGVILPLNSLIEKHAPNVKAMFEKTPEAKEYAYTPDGYIYALPSVNESYLQQYPKKMWISQPWLQKLGLSMPQTTEEFYQVLKEFKTGDPNGNGIADEIPLAGANPDKNANNEIESFLMMSFLFYDKATYLYMDGDKLVFAADQPEYKEGLKYMKKLFAEGLIARDSFIQDRKALTSLTENESVNRVGCVPAYAWGHFTVESSPGQRYKDFINVPPLKGPTGLRQAFNRGKQVLVGKFAISRACKIPEIAVRWIDWFYNPEAMLAEGYHAGMGKEGIGWEKAEEGLKGMDGRPAVYQRIIPGGTPTNHHWWQTYPTYENLDYLCKIAATEEKEIVGFREVREKYEPYSISRQVPHLFFSEEQLAEYGDIKSNVKKVVENYQVKFITGALDIDRGWDAYLRELQYAKVDRYVDQMQKAYDARSEKQTAQ